MAKGIQARGGIGRIISMIGEVAFSMYQDQPLRRPTGIAMIAAKPNPQNTLNRLAETCWLIKKPEKSLSFWVNIEINVVKTRCGLGR